MFPGGRRAKQDWSFDSSRRTHISDLHEAASFGVRHDRGN